MAKLLDQIIWVLTISLLSSFIIFNQHEWLRAILVVITCLVGFFTLIRYNIRPHISITRYHIGIIAFMLFCAASSRWALDSQAALTQAGTFFQILICMSVLWIYYQYKNSVTELLDTMRWAGYVVAIYAIMHYGVSGMKEVLMSASRLQGEFANTNSIAMFIAFSLIITLYKWLYYKFSWSFLFALPTLVVLAACGSRKGIIMLIAGTFLVYLFRYASRNLFITLLKSFIIIAVGLLIFKGILSLSIFDGINHRMEGFLAFFTDKDLADGSTLIRMQMLRIGWDQFLQTPFLGMGMGNPYILTERYFGANLTYLHNNYIELLAAGGLVGTLLYYAMWFYPLYYLIRYFRLPNKDTATCLIMIILLLTILDWGRVGYTDKQTYFYLMIFYLQTRILQKQALSFVPTKTIKGE